MFILLRKNITAWLIPFLLTGCMAVNGEKVETIISGKVVSVKDGDTIEVLYEGKPLRVRLAHIDCPELKNSQPYGKAAKQFTSDLCFGQQVQLLNDGEYDRYKRLIAVVINSNGKNINKELVSAGMAWHYLKYSDDADYTELENQARMKCMGIWQDEDAVAPWEWRGRTSEQNDSQE